MAPGDETASRSGVAEAYDRHVGRYGAQLAAGLIDIAAVRRGQRVLDVGCGPGPLTAALAEVVGSDHVAAVDPSEPFVAACRARVPGADVRVGVGERLPWDDGGFDAALAQLVVQLMDNPAAGVGEMRRVTRPGGVVATCVWDSGAMPALRAFWDAALAVAPERAGSVDDRHRVGYPSAGPLSAVLSQAGLVNVDTGEITVTAAYEDFDDLWWPFTTGTGHSGACLASLETDEQERVRADARRRLDVPDGSFTLTARAWWARAAVPEA